ncbi:hypothetical protein IIA15_11420, partial [candidate division TA06 bacterium]|nr:hypothetical protein [candidate division TA06 bacterium]
VVVDALPNKKSARAMVKAFPGRVWMVYYGRGMKREISLNKDEGEATVDRTESLDVSGDLCVNRFAVIPSAPHQHYEEFIRQMCSVAKQKQTDEKTGDEVWVYISLGADHFRHAWNYLSIAKTIFEETKGLKLEFGFLGEPAPEVPTAPLDRKCPICESGLGEKDIIEKAKEKKPGVMKCKVCNSRVEYRLDEQPLPAARLPQLPPGEFGGLLNVPGLTIRAPDVVIEPEEIKGGKK